MAGMSSKKRCKGSLDTQEQDRDATEDFRDYMADVVSKGHTCLSIALGHELRLFDVLGDFDESKSCRVIAETAGCKEGYIKAWLRTMVSGKIVEVVENEKGETLFFLPKDRLSSLTSTENNLACLTRQVPIYSTVYPDVVRCVKKDGPNGVDYERFAALDVYWEETNKMMHNSRKHLSFILNQIPGLITQLENGTTVCDVGCGPGHRANLIAGMFPNTKVTGIDISEETVAIAKTKADELMLPNVTFMSADGTSLPENWAETFGYVTMSDVIHHVKNQEKMLAEVHRILTPGGVFSLFDFDVHERLADNYGKPSASVMYAFNLLYDLPASLGDDGESGEGHGHHGEVFAHGHAPDDGHSGDDKKPETVLEGHSLEEVCEGFEKPMNILRKVGFEIEIKQIAETLECHIIATKKK
ncbi:uncharacterized protein LOC106154929 isoform X2 [Lingula anatina]|uniref:Uncharacterized protein LOC106154929 isoform X2 n=1 Tax=Lingula anatina TaxID=7574 RepID=A0A1S3HFW7_LINAN|nr:uncharacterized protein LOC106154929 isoform X2 [Lingula anatina]|eukprot:XP_013384947.1 uncharacterized protein LOC106154929 isoform X2 [Lingula anatina]